MSAEERAARALMGPLSLRDRVAQLVIGVCYGEALSTRNADFQKYRHWVRDLHIGGLIVNNRVFNGIARNAEPHATALFLNQMQKLAKTPLIVGGDFERGASMRINAGTRFPYNMAYGAARDVEGSRIQGLITAREARALGFHWVFAPVADVNVNPDNPVINLRSYGENPDDVAKHVAAYIDGAHSDPKNRVLVTAKHFPGHGDTNVDSHLGLPRLDVSKQRLDEVELKPFRAAIAAGIDSIMTAHMEVTAIESNEIPATVSAKVLTGLLREELKFPNLIVTDALDMAGVALKFNSGEVSVRALEAGADVLLMPPDPERAIRAVVAAIENKRLSRERVEASVIRILAAKIRVGVIKKKLVDLDAISDALDSPEGAEAAQKISDHAVTLVRNEGALVPIKDAGHACVVVAVERRQSQLGQRFLEEFHRRAKSERAIVVDATFPLAAMQAMLNDMNACSVVVAASFASVTPSADVVPFLQKLTEESVPVVLVSLGGPYLLANVPKAAAYLAAFSPTVPSELSAVKALFGEMAITGKMPVTIPGFAKYGDGIELRANSR
jgi:beta-N-acetylhexosaminidase